MAESKDEAHQEYMDAHLKRLGDVGYLQRKDHLY
jgi:hypothetical protein